MWMTGSLDLCAALCLRFIIFWPFITFPHLQVCDSQAEARRDAARVALMNSLVNELPCRLISPQFISQSLQQAAAHCAVSVSLWYIRMNMCFSLNLSCTVVFGQVSVEDACNSSTSIGTYSLLLHSYVGRTMLEFQVNHKANVFERKDMCFLTC